MPALYRQIPNALTLGNLLLGILSIVAIAVEQTFWVLYFLPIALILDFLDGLVARALKAFSEIGKQLDSLADLVSFGVAPAFILFDLLAHPALAWDILPVFILPLAAAVRLARFNLDERQELDFRGLPTPAAALIILGFLLWVENDYLGLASFFTSPGIIYALAIGLSGLMVSGIPMFSLKIKSRRWTGNEIKIIFTAVAVILLVLFRANALLMIMLWYLLLAIAGPYWSRR